MPVFKRYLTEAEEAILFRTVRRVNCIYAKRDLAWMEALRATGMRISAFSRLTVGDVQIARRNDVLHIPSFYQKRGKRHDKSQDIALNKRARRAFSLLLRIRKKMGYTLDPDAPLIMSRNHQRLSVRSYQERFKQWVIKAGIDPAASPHWFRHTLAKRMIKNSTANDPLSKVSVALNHSNNRTAHIYTMPDKEEMQQAFNEAG